MTPPPTFIDGQEITGATIDGQDVEKITVDGQTVFTPPPTLPVAYQNLIAWYPFDSAEYGGSNADDVTAILGGSGDDTAFDGNVSGATYQPTDGVTDIRAGPNSGAYEFNNDKINTPLNPDESQSLTAMAWFYPFNFGGGSFNFGAVVDTQKRLTIRVRQPDKIQLGVGRVGHTEVGKSTNQWYHAVVSQDSNNAKFYVDGTKVNQQTSDPSDGSRNLGIGENPNGDGVFDGYIDEVRVYDTKLTESQVFDIYQNTEP
jgi:hypothetical protein